MTRSVSIHEFGARDDQKLAELKRTQPLFTPVRMGSLYLPNRIVMAPLTRMRAEARSSPTCR